MAILAVGRAVATGVANQVFKLLVQYIDERSCLEIVYIPFDCSRFRNRRLVRAVGQTAVKIHVALLPDAPVLISMGSVDVTVNMVADVTGRGPPALEVLDICNSIFHGFTSVSELMQTKDDFPTLTGYGMWNRSSGV